MTTRFLAVVLLLVVTGCARKEPSPEYTRASERFNKLYAKELDDAYVDPAIHEVEALLEKVPADSLDAQAAAQLLNRIRTNRARIEQAGPVEVNGRGPRDSYTMVDSERCRRAMPGLTNSIVLADSETVMGLVPKSALRRTLPDGGAPPPPAPPDAGS